MTHHMDSVAAYIQYLHKEAIMACPYCNSNAKFFYLIDNYIGTERTNLYIKCPRCDAATDMFNTEDFCFIFDENHFRHYTHEEVVKKVIEHWNSGRYNLRTLLSHMDYQEKIIWQIGNLLKDVYWGSVPLKSVEYKSGQELRILAEEMGFSMQPGTAQDFKQIAYELFQSPKIRSIIEEYLKEIDNEDMDIDKIRRGAYRFSQGLEEGAI